MNIHYDCSCFERNLIIVFPDEYEYLRKEIEQMLDDYYYEWHDAENIKDPEERAYVLDSCLEEYMIERLSETYNMWEEWASKYYGYDPDEFEHFIKVENRTYKEASLIGKANEPLKIW